MTKKKQQQICSLDDLRAARPHLFLTEASFQNNPWLQCEISKLNSRTSFELGKTRIFVKLN